MKKRFLNILKVTSVFLSVSCALQGCGHRKCCYVYKTTCAGVPIDNPTDDRNLIAIFPYADTVGIYNAENYIKAINETFPNSNGALIIVVR